MEWLPAFLLFWFHILVDFVDQSAGVAEAILANTLLYPASVAGSSASGAASLPNIFFGGPVKNVSVSLNYNPIGSSPNVISITNTSNTVSITFPLPPQALSNVSRIPVYGFPPFLPAPSYSAYGTPGFLEGLAQQIPYIPSLPEKVPQINYLYGPAVYGGPPAVFPSFDYVSSYQPTAKPYDFGTLYKTSSPGDPGNGYQQNSYGPAGGAYQQPYGNTGYSAPGYQQQQPTASYQSPQHYQREPSPSYSISGYPPQYPESSYSSGGAQQPYSGSAQSYGGGYQNQYPQTYTNPSVANYAAAPENRYPYVHTYPVYPSFYQNSTNASTAAAVSTTIASLTKAADPAPPASSSTAVTTGTTKAAPASTTAVASGNSSTTNPPLSAKGGAINGTNESDDLSFSLADGGFEDLLADNSTANQNDLQTENSTVESSTNASTTQTTTLPTTKSSTVTTVKITTAPGKVLSSSTVRKLNSSLTVRALASTEVPLAAKIASFPTATSSSSSTSPSETTSTTQISSSPTSGSTQPSFTSSAIQLTSSATSGMTQTSSMASAVQLTSAPTGTTVTSTTFPITTLSLVPAPKESNSTTTEESSPEAEDPQTTRKRKPRRTKRIKTTTQGFVDEASADYDEDYVDAMRRPFRDRQSRKKKLIKISTSVDLHEDVFHIPLDENEEDMDFEEPAPVSRRHKKRRRSRPLSSATEDVFVDEDEITLAPSTRARTRIRTFAKKVKFRQSTTMVPLVLLEDGFVSADGDLVVDGEIVTPEPEPVSVLPASTKSTRPRGPVPVAIMLAATIASSPTVFTRFSRPQGPLSQSTSTTSTAATTTEPQTTPTSSSTTETTISSTTPTTSTAVSITPSTAISTTTVSTTTTVEVKFLSTAPDFTVSASSSASVPTSAVGETTVSPSTAFAPTTSFAISGTTLRSVMLPLPTRARPNSTAVAAVLQEITVSPVVSKTSHSINVTIGGTTVSVTTRVAASTSNVTISAVTLGTSLAVTTELRDAHGSTTTAIADLNSTSSGPTTMPGNTTTEVPFANNGREKDTAVLLQGSALALVNSTSSSTVSATAATPATTATTTTFAPLDPAYFGSVQLINEYNQPVRPGTIYRHVRPQDWGVQPRLSCL